jgi:orotidine-5'-phosphate decarboxylase
LFSALFLEEITVRKISLALDKMPLKAVVQFVPQLSAHIQQIATCKVHDLVDRLGPIAVAILKALGFPVWVDYKLHDTPDTVAARAQALCENGAAVITVHASGGISMMEAAVKAAQSYGTEIRAITVLTSLSDKEIARVYGKERTRQEIVHELALMAKESGVPTVVCSAQEVGYLKQSADLEGMKFVVPGTRSAGVALGQQKRSATPAQAVADGADELVAGSQVTKAEDPVKAFADFAAEMDEGER